MRGAWFYAGNDGLVEFVGVVQVCAAKITPENWSVELRVQCDTVRCLSSGICRGWNGTDAAWASSIQHNK